MSYKKLKKIHRFFGETSGERGFTLIELLTVTGIIFILSALAVSNYHQGNKQVILDMQANLLAQNLRRAQEWALAAHQINGVAFHGYGIYAVPGNNYYIFFLDNGSDGGAIVPGNGRYDQDYDVVQEMVILDKDVEILSCAPDPASVDYMVPDPAAKIGGLDAIAEQRVVFRLKNSSTIRTIIANKAGLVYVE